MYNILERLEDVASWKSLIETPTTAKASSLSVDIQGWVFKHMFPLGKTPLSMVYKLVTEQNAEV